MKEHLPRIESVVLPIVESLGLELVEVSIAGLGSASVIRIFIHRYGGATVKDITNVSRKVSATLDELDFIEHKYFLEVSSPGLDRPLKTIRDFKRSIGEKIRVIKEGGETFEGKLLAIDTTNIILETSNGEHNIDFSTVAVGKIVF